MQQIGRKMFAAAPLRVAAAMMLFWAACSSAQALGAEDALMKRLAEAATEVEGRSAEDAVWRYWLDEAPTAEVRGHIDEGMRKRDGYDFAGAEAEFDRVVELAPGYAEGYNQRAFARFLRDNMEGALADLERTLELKPVHFGALSGMYHVLFRMGRTEAATANLEKAVALHPWLKERSLLPRSLGKPL
jgi:tetratricopeptide (TPR) repeat protein